MERISTLAFSTLLYGIALAMKFTAWRHPAFRERLKEQDLVGQIRVKAGTGRYYVIKNGKVSSRHGIHPNPDVVVALKSARLGLQNLHAPKRPARQDQRGQVLQHDARRRAGQSHLVHVHARVDAAGRLALRRRRRQRRDALRQHGERRTSVRLRQGRQDRSHDADRVRRPRPATVDHQSERQRVHAAAQDVARPARPDRQVDDLFARPDPLSDEASRLRSER